MEEQLGHEADMATRERVKSYLDSVEPYRYVFALLERMGMRGLLYHTSVSNVDRFHNTCGADALPYAGYNLVAGFEKGHPPIL